MRRQVSFFNQFGHRLTIGRAGWGRYISPDKLRFTPTLRGAGSEQYPPRLLLGLLVYSYATGEYSSSRIERSTYESGGATALRGQGWLYLAVILDAWSRRVLIWSCAPTLPPRSSSPPESRRETSPDRPPGHPPLRPWQYTDARLIEPLSTTGMVPSMIESFWSTLKTETGMDVIIPATRKEAEFAVFDYIETFYNPRRRHRSLGQISPVAFELKHQSHLNFFRGKPISISNSVDAV